MENGNGNGNGKGRGKWKGRQSDSIFEVVQTITWKMKRSSVRFYFRSSSDYHMAFVMI